MLQRLEKAKDYTDVIAQGFQEASSKAAASAEKWDGNWTTGVDEQA